MASRSIAPRLMLFRSGAGKAFRFAGGTSAQVAAAGMRFDCKKWTNENRRAQPAQPMGES